MIIMFVLRQWFFNQDVLELRGSFVKYRLLGFSFRIFD